MNQPDYDAERILRVARTSDIISRRELRDFVDGGSGGVHASVMRSYQALELVVGWLHAGVPTSVVLMLVSLIRKLADEHEAKGKDHE